MKKLLLVLLMLPLVGMANEMVITEKAPIDLSDNASLQRGAKTFVNYCLNCHSANYMRYNRLLDIGLTEEQIKNNLLFAGEKVGDTMRVSMNPKDTKKWFGVAPPDLSVEVRARGADWQGSSRPSALAGTSMRSSPPMSRSARSASRGSMRS